MVLLYLFACSAGTQKPTEPVDTMDPDSSETDSSETATGPDDSTEDTDETDPDDRWHIQSGPIPPDLIDQMLGTTMHDGCPVGLDDLVLMEPAYWDMSMDIQTGRIILAAELAPAMAEVFEAMFRAGFQIRAMDPASTYAGSDGASMAADNTSAFNCRAVTGGSSWSQHSYGNAIDINPRENPYVRGSTVLPPEGAAYTDRQDVRPGMIVEGDAVTAVFDKIGWGWGGRWGSLKDYQHFSSNGQ
jgi:hypothetical protein